MIFLRLLFGPDRGLLFTQPWVFVVAAAALRRRGPSGLWAGLTALGGLLWMNASFASGWEAGWSAGPRYLSAALPVLGYLAGTVYDGLAPWARRLAALLLGVSVVLRALVFDQSVLVDRRPLWGYLLRGVAETAPVSWLKIVFFLAVVAGAAWLTAGAAWWGRRTPPGAEA
jgi:hypothetical protein